jgi:diguanylate cyclase (GGDEF)-like protein
VAVQLESSIVGLAIQLLGIALVTMLSGLLTRSIQRPFLAYWTMAWVSLTISLSALLAAFVLTLDPRPFLAIYFFAEYIFGYLLVAGCRNYATGSHLDAGHRWGLAPFGLVALVLPLVSDNFNLLMVPHGLIMASFWGRAYFALRPASQFEQHGPGLKVASVALALLALDFIHYAPMCGYAGLIGVPRAFAYLKYSSLYDLILEMLLGFGTIMLVMESVRRELEGVNRELAAAGARLQMQAERDPLTLALNRHAFQALLEKPPSTDLRAGSVVLLDIDNFKQINDTLGHTVGDAALRTVAAVIRSIIRADDLLFRWGGDEFLIVLFGLDEQQVRVRLSGLNTKLRELRLSGALESVSLGVSHGVAALPEFLELEPAIERADQEMYRRKQAHKAAASRPAQAEVLLGTR